MSEATTPLPLEPIINLPVEMESRRILLVDDTPTIHEDFRKILGASPVANPQLADLMASVLGETPQPARTDVVPGFELDSAYQGEEAIGKVKAACAAGRPYALAFVDVRMPPGLDGVETILRLWEEDPALQTVICTAFSDYSWSQMAEKLGPSDRLLILKKPFDPVEVLQFAHALTKKWQLARQASDTLGGVRQMLEDCSAVVGSRMADLHREIAARVHAEERSVNTFNACPLPMALLRADGLGCVDANRAFLALAGCSREAALGRPLAALGLDLGEDATALLRASEPATACECTFSVHGAAPRPARFWSESLTLGEQPHVLLVLDADTERLAVGV
ncbi:MAG: response regulator [Chthoniobacteraceae bacterium]